VSGHKQWSNLRDKLRADPVQNEHYEPMRRATGDAVRLGRLREARRRTQVELAQVIGTSQANISRLESRDDLYLSTLTEYVDALGGRLELQAVFPDQVIVIDVAAPKELSAAGPSEWNRQLL
jgi:DNA-binding Xre family transcriptional regulator